MRQHHVQHPGPPSLPRYGFIAGYAHHARLALHPGDNLAATISAAMAQNGADTAIVTLDGIVLASACYLIPGEPKDNQHAAWYSDTFSADGIKIEHGTAIVGRKNGAWFTHCHALWQDEKTHKNYAGHLLTDHSIIGTAASIEIIAFKGGAFTANFDPETNFTLFQLAKSNPQTQINAAIITVRPHEDLRQTIDKIAAELNIESGRLFGIGSLNGAEFHDAPPMPPYLSEILLLPSARIENGRCTALPLTCVDDKRAIYSGDLKAGCGPVLVTAELMLVKTS